MRFACMAMALVFAVFAGLQYNDPDAIVWIALYSYAALVSVLALRASRWWPPAVGLAVYAPGFVWLAPAIDRGWWHSEQAREGLGLLIAAVWMVVLLIVRARGSRDAYSAPAA